MIIKDEILSKIDDIIKNRKVFLVGGYLRNYFLNNEISPDRDLVCLDGAIDLAKETAQKLNATFVELDSENKIYRVVLNDKKNYFDISEAIENDIEKDIKRRDFTINSIFYDLNKKEIYDPNYGLKDLKKGIIKAISFDNMLDDPLRLLRMYRFRAITGFKIDKDLKEFSKQNFFKINSVAKERINYEIIHLFQGKYLTETLLEMFEDGALEIIFPFIKEIKKVPSNTHHHLDLVHHSIETVKHIKSKNPLLKIAALYHDIGKPSTWTIEPSGRHRFIGHDIKGAQLAKKELEKLKFSNKQIAYISDMVKYHIYPASLINCSDNQKAYARFIRKLNTNTPDIIELSKADRLSARGVAVSDEMVEKALSHLDKLLKYYQEVEAMAKNPKCLLNGKEIMEILNIKPSKLVGIITEELLEMQLSKEITTKEQAINFIQQYKNKAAKDDFNGAKN